MFLSGIHLFKILDSRQTCPRESGDICGNDSVVVKFSFHFAQNLIYKVLTSYNFDYYRQCYIARQGRNQKTAPFSPPSQGGDAGAVKKLPKTCPHETCPRENGKWGKEVFTE